MSQEMERRPVEGAPSDAGEADVEREGSDTKFNAQAIPELLKKHPNWVAYGLDPESGRPKCPLIASKRTVRASTRKPDTWCEWKFASLVREKYCDDKDTGIGFVFTEKTGLIYIDVDDCLDEAGACRDWAWPFIQPFIGKAYIERSPSGRGLHIIAKGKLPNDVEGGVAKFPEAATGDRVPEVAMFTAGKYTTITGDVWQGQQDIQDVTAEAAEVWAAAGIRAKGSGADAGEAPGEEDLPEVDKRRLTRSTRAMLNVANVADATDRSAARFKVYAQLAERFTAEEIFALVLDHPDWYAASGAAEKGREHTWQDICRAVAKSKTAKQEFEVVKEQEAAEAGQQGAPWKDLGIDVITTMTKSGPVTEAVHGPANVARYLKGHPERRGRLRFNEFTQNIELDGKPITEDHQLVPLGTPVRRYFGWSEEPPVWMLWHAVRLAAMPYNPITEYLRSLEWDFAERITSIAAKVGLEDTPLTRTILRLWLIGLVARALRPGCKNDTVLVLEGPEGRKKSEFFKVMAGGYRYFTDSPVDPSSKDGLQVMAEKWIIELAELVSIRRHEANRVKQFLSSAEDTFRAPYARTPKSHPRHFVIVGTTNDEEYLESTTGNRRFWPVAVQGKLDLEWLTANRDQILAEAVWAFELGEPWWFEEQPEELVLAQDARRTSDALEDKVAPFLVEVAAEAAKKGTTADFSLASLMERLGYGADRKDIQVRLSAVLRRLGWARVKRRVGGRPEHRWSNPALPEGRGATVRVLTPGRSAPSGEGAADADEGALGAGEA